MDDWVDPAQEGDYGVPQPTRRAIPTWDAEMRGDSRYVDNAEPSAWDNVQAVQAGGKGIVKSLVTLGELAGRKLDLPEVEIWARKAVQAIDESIAGDYEQMSRAGREEIESKWLSADREKGEKSIWDSDVNTTRAIRLKLLSALPSLVATIVPASIAARGLGVVAGALAGGASEGALTVGEVAGSFFKEIDNASPEEMLESPTYRSVVQGGGSDIEGREAVKREVGGGWLAAVGVGTALIGATGVSRFAAARAAGKEAGEAVGKGLIRRGVEGFAEEAVGEGAQGAAAAATTQTLTREAIPSREYNYLDIAEAGVEEGVIGGLLGGGVNMAIGRRPERVDKTPEGRIADPGQQAALSPDSTESTGPTEPPGPPADGDQYRLAIPDPSSRYPEDRPTQGRPYDRDTETYGEPYRWRQPGQPPQMQPGATPDRVGQLGMFGDEPIAPGERAEAPAGAPLAAPEEQGSLPFPDPSSRYPQDQPYQGRAYDEESKTFGDRYRWRQPEQPAPLSPGAIPDRDGQYSMAPPAPPSQTAQETLRKPEDERIRQSQLKAADQANAVQTPGAVDPKAGQKPVDPAKVAKKVASDSVESLTPEQVDSIRSAMLAARPAGGTMKFSEVKAVAEGAGVPLTAKAVANLAGMLGFQTRKEKRANVFVVPQVAPTKRDAAGDNEFGEAFDGAPTQPTTSTKTPTESPAAPAPETPPADDDWGAPFDEPTTPPPPKPEKGKKGKKAKETSKAKEAPKTELKPDEAEVEEEAETLRKRQEAGPTAPVADAQTDTVLESVAERVEKEEAEEKGDAVTNTERARSGEVVSSEPSPEQALAAKEEGEVYSLAEATETFDDPVEAFAATPEGREAFKGSGVSVGALSRAVSAMGLGSQVVEDLQIPQKILKLAKRRGVPLAVAAKAVERNVKTTRPARATAQLKAREKATEDAAAAKVAAEAREKAAAFGEAGRQAPRRTAKRSEVLVSGRATPSAMVDALQPLLLPREEVSGNAVGRTIENFTKWATSVLQAVKAERRLRDSVQSLVDFYTRVVANPPASAGELTVAFAAERKLAEAVLADMGVTGDRAEIAFLDQARAKLLGEKARGPEVVKAMQELYDSAESTGLLKRNNLDEKERKQRKDLIARYPYLAHVFQAIDILRDQAVKRPGRPLSEQTALAMYRELYMADFYERLTHDPLMVRQFENRVFPDETFVTSTPYEQMYNSDSPLDIDELRRKVARDNTVTVVPANRILDSILAAGRRIDPRVRAIAEMLRTIAGDIPVFLTPRNVSENSRAWGIVRPVSAYLQAGKDSLDTMMDTTRDFIEKGMKLEKGVISAVNNSVTDFGLTLVVNAGLKQANFTETVLHELLHAVTLDALTIRTPEGEAFRSAMRELANAVDAVAFDKNSSAYKQVMDGSSAITAMKQHRYGTSNLAEFVVALFTNPTVMEDAARVSVPNGFYKRHGMDAAVINYRANSVADALIKTISRYVSDFWESLTRILGFSARKPRLTALEVGVKTVLSYAANPARIHGYAAYWANNGTGFGQADLTLDRSEADRGVGFAMQALPSLVEQVSGAAPAALQKASRPWILEKTHQARRVLFGFSAMKDLVSYATTHSLYDWPRDFLAMVQSPVEWFETLRRQREAMAVHQRKESEALIHDLQKLERTDEASLNQIQDLLIRETELQLHADFPIDHPKNAHLAKEQYLPGRLAHKDLHAQYNRLSKEQKALHKRIAEYFAEDRPRVQRASIQAILNHRFNYLVSRDLKTNEPVSDYAKSQAKDGFKAMTERFFTNTQTDADIKFLAGEQAAKEAMKSIALLRREATLKGNYVPLRRYGDFVVTYKTGEDSTQSFDSPESYRSFMDAAMQRGLVPLETKHEYFDKDGNRVNKAGVPLDKDLSRNPDYQVAAPASTKITVKLQTQGFEAFDSFGEAEERRADLVAEGAQEVSAVQMRKNVFENVKELAPAQLRAITDSLATVEGLNDATRQAAHRALAEAALKVMPGTSIRQSLLKRRNVRGAAKDLTRAVAWHASASTSLQAALTYDPQITRARMAMLSHTEKLAKAGDVRTMERQQMLEELALREGEGLDVEATAGRVKGPVMRTLQSMTFIYYLMSPAYTLINAAQHIVVGLPYLMARYKVRDVMREYRKAVDIIGVGALTKDTLSEFIAAAKKQGIENGNPVIENLIQRVKDSGEPDSKELVAMLERLVDLRTIDITAGQELGRVLIEKRTGWVQDKTLYMEDLARAFPAGAEVFNRAVLAIMTYRLAKAGLGVDGAIAAADQAVRDTQFDYTQANVARYMDARQGRLLGMAMTFKKYAQGMYSLLIRNAYESVAQKRPNESEAQFQERRKIARKTLLYTLASHGAVAGAMGLPLEPIKVAVAMVSFLLGADEPYDFEKAMRNGLTDLWGADAAEMFMKGLPRAANMDLSTRMGLDNLALGKELRSYAMRDIQEYALSLMLGAPGGMALQPMAAYEHMREGNPGRAAEVLLPKAFRDVLKATRMSSTGVTTRRGERIDDNVDMSLYESVMMALGVQPGRVAETYEGRAAVKGAERRFTKERSDLMKRYSEAENAGERAQVWQEVLKRNREWRAEGLPPLTLESLRRSMSARERRAETMVRGVPLARDRQVLGEAGRFANTE